MRNNIYTIILIVAALFFTSVADARSSKNEALYNQVKKSYVLNEDGSQEMRVVKELTIYTHTAMNRTYGESFVVYNPECQKVIINKSYTTQVDGTIIKTPENAFVEVLPRSAAKVPAYNHLKELVIVHTGLELGATIFLDYTVVTKTGYFSELDIFEIVRESSPIKSYELMVTVPENVELNYTSINANYKPKVQVIDGKDVLKWRIKNIPASSKAPEVTVQAGDIEVIVVSTGDQKGIAAFNNDDNVDNVLGDVSSSSEEEKIKAVKDYIKTNYALVRLSFKDTGYRIRSMAEVMSTAYGTEAELTQLMCLLLKEIGVPSQVVVSYPTAYASGQSAISEFFVLVGEDNLLSAKRNDLKSLPLDYFTFKRVSNGEEAVDIEQDVADLDLKHDLKVSLKDATEIGNGYYFYSLPDSKEGVAYRPYSKYNSIRKDNLLLPRKVQETHTYTIELDGLDLSSEIKDRTIKNKAGELSISIKKDGNMVYVTREISIPNQLIVPSLYSDFKTLIKEWSDESGRKLLLKK